MIILEEPYLLRCQDQSNHLAPVVKSSSQNTIVDFHSVSLVLVRDLQTDTGLLIICASAFFFSVHIFKSLNIRGSTVLNIGMAMMWPEAPTHHDLFV